MIIRNLLLVGIILFVFLRLDGLPAWAQMLPGALCLAYFVQFSLTLMVCLAQNSTQTAAAAHNQALKYSSRLHFVGWVALFGWIIVLKTWGDTTATMVVEFYATIVIFALLGMIVHMMLLFRGFSNP